MLLNLLADQLDVFKASIENTDTGLPFNEYGYNHYTKEEGTKASFCYLEIQEGAPFAITIEKSPSFTHSRSDDWRAVSFIDGKRLHGSWWDPDSREHRVEGLYLGRDEESVKCKMRFGSISEDGSAALNKEGSRHLGRIDIVLSRGLWIPLPPEDLEKTVQTGPMTISVAEGTSTTKNGSDSPSRTVYASDPVPVLPSPTRAMMFAERDGEPAFYSFHFILQTRETLINYGLIPEDAPPPPPPPPSTSSRSVAVGGNRVKRRRRDADDADTEEAGDLLRQLEILRGRLKKSEELNQKLIARNKRLKNELRRMREELEGDLLSTLRAKDDGRTVVRS